MKSSQDTLSRYDCAQYGPKSYVLRKQHSSPRYPNPRLIKTNIPRPSSNPLGQLPHPPYPLKSLFFHPDLTLVNRTAFVDPVGRNTIAVSYGLDEFTRTGREAVNDDEAYLVGLLELNKLNQSGCFVLSWSHKRNGETGSYQGDLQCGLSM